MYRTHLIARHGYANSRRPDPLPKGDAAGYLQNDLSDVKHFVVIRKPSQACAGVLGDQIDRNERVPKAVSGAWFIR